METEAASPRHWRSWRFFGNQDGNRAWKLRSILQCKPDIYGKTSLEQRLLRNKVNYWYCTLTKESYFSLLASLGVHPHSFLCHQKTKTPSSPVVDCVATSEPLVGPPVLQATLRNQPTAGGIHPSCLFLKQIPQERYSCQSKKLIPASKCHLPLLTVLRVGTFLKNLKLKRVSCCWLFCVLPAKSQFPFLSLHSELWSGSCQPWVPREESWVFDCAVCECQDRWACSQWLSNSNWWRSLRLLWWQIQGWFGWFPPNLNQNA